MPRDPQMTTSPLYTQVQISPSAHSVQAIEALSERAERGEQTQLLREILASQDRQNELLEELVTLIGTPHRQRLAELNQWKHHNPRLSQRCRNAAEALGKVQTEFLESLTSDVSENAEAFLDGEFMLNEFVDRFGPRLAHLSSILQVLSHLSSTANVTADAPEVE